MVDGKMRAVSSRGAMVDSLRVAVLAALNIADELATLRERYEHLAGTTATSQPGCATAPAPSPACSTRSSTAASPASQPLSNSQDAIEHRTNIRIVIRESPPTNSTRTNTGRTRLHRLRKNRVPHSCGLIAWVGIERSSTAVPTPPQTPLNPSQKGPPTNSEPTPEELDFSGAAQSVAPAPIPSGGPRPREGPRRGTRPTPHRDCPISRATASASCSYQAAGA